MEIFFFILKSLGLSVLISIICGFIAGFFLNFFKSPHPHQIIPNWLIFGMMSAIAGIVISIVLIVIMLLSKNLDLKFQMIIFSLIISTVNIGLVIKSAKR